MVHEIIGAEQAELLARERHEEQGAFEGLFVQGCHTGDFQHSCRSGCVVIRAVMNLSDLRGRERMFIAESQMVVMSANDHPLVF